MARKKKDAIDIAIIGAGPVGCLFAGLYRQAFPSHTCRVFDADEKKPHAALPLAETKQNIVLHGAARDAVSSFLADDALFHRVSRLVVAGSRGSLQQITLPAHNTVLSIPSHELREKLYAPVAQCVQSGHRLHAHQCDQSGGVSLEFACGDEHKTIHADKVVITTSDVDTAAYRYHYDQTALCVNARIDGLAQCCAMEYLIPKGSSR